MTRIFLATSHLSSLMMALYARRTAKPNSKDILLVESPRMKSSLLKLIHDTGNVHPWTKIHDFVTTVEDHKDMKPTLRKRLTRQLKSKPVIKQVYRALYQKFLAKEHIKRRKQLAYLLRDHVNDPEVSLFLLTQTTWNPILKELFPKAHINYCEHGLGDYLAPMLPEFKGDFYCLFPEAYRRLLAEKNLPYAFIHSLVRSEEFEEASRTIINTHPQSSGIIHSLQLPSPSVLILMEAVEMYHVPKRFWADYLEKCISVIPDPHQYIFLLKPHPIQSKESIEMSKAWLELHNYNYRILDDPTLTGMSVEVLFPAIKEKIHHVFALFSSSVFYLSALYPASSITFHYSYSFMARHTSKAPDMYQRHFKGLEELIKKVFSENCKEF